MDEVIFSHAELLNCSFSDTKLNNSNFEKAKIFSSDFSLANCRNSDFKGAFFNKVNLYNAEFDSVNIENTSFDSINEKNMPILQQMGNSFKKSLEKQIKFPKNSDTRMNMCGTSFLGAKLNNETYFRHCKFSIKSDFRTIYFESGSYAPGMKQTLRYCNRRHNWEDWYKDQNFLLSLIVKAFF